MGRLVPGVHQFSRHLQAWTPHLRKEEPGGLSGLGSHCSLWPRHRRPRAGPEPTGSRLAPLLGGRVQRLPLPYTSPRPTPTSFQSALTEHLPATSDPHLGLPLTSTAPYTE